MKNSNFAKAAVISAAALLFQGCASLRTIDESVLEGATAAVVLPDEKEPEQLDFSSAEDSLVVTGEDGRRIIILRAVRDEQTGEMVATEELRPAVLYATFRNIAERDGLVNLNFRIQVSDTLQDPSWQLRFFPQLYIQRDTVPLEPIYITGEDFRKAQQRGYERYAAYLQSIHRDSLRIIDPQLEDFNSRPNFLGGDDASLHFTRETIRRRTQRKLASSSEVFGRCVPTPLNPPGVRLDTLSGLAPFAYDYLQTIPARAGLRKAEVTIKGGIFSPSGMLYEIAESEPVTFYISSIGGLADTTRVRDRKYRRGVEALEERDYKEAIRLLAPYRDENTALAYMSLGYNATAEEVLLSLPETARTLYCRAIICARRGDEKGTVENYLRAIALEPRYRYRGNLDPEIAAIIRKYHLQN